MLQKKICMLGAFSVGKTSLVTRFVDSIFGDKYHTTVGVRISKKLVNIKSLDVTLMIWDLAGQDDITRLRTSYLRGTSGFIVVADGTRPFSLKTALNMHREAREYAGELPFVVIINKSDLMDTDNGHKWDVDQALVDELTESGAEVVYTSAKTGEGVNDMFHQLATNMLLEHKSLEVS